jgi:hypothetical protein
MLTLSRLQSVPLPKLMPFLQSVPLPKLMPFLQSVPLPKLVPLHDVREAVENDMRGLFAGMEALSLHELPAANDETLVTEPVTTAPVRAFHPPLGWISLAAAGALFATLGFAQIQVQRHLSPTVQQPQKPRPATRKQKKVRRIRNPDRTDYSRGT